MEHKDMQLKWDNMRKGIEGQSVLLREAPRVLYAEIREKLTTVPSRVYLTGCGDSHYCGFATRLAFEDWSGITTEPLQALEFSRYTVQYAPTDSLLVAVSNSGEVSRSVEAVKYARHRGLDTIGVTYKLDSRLAEEAQTVIKFDYRDIGFGPGTMSYMASMLTLYCIAIRLGVLSGKRSVAEAEGLLSRLEGTSDSVDRTIEACREPMRRLAEEATESEKFFVVGGGPNYGTALFGMAKLIESARNNTVAQELEEWAHEQYFVTQPGTCTFVLAVPGRSLDRAREQLLAIRDMGGTAVAVCNHNDEETPHLADVVAPVHFDEEEALSPIPYCVPLELFAYHFAVSHGKVMLGFDDEKRKEVNFRQIFHSAIPSWEDLSSR